MIDAHRALIYTMVMVSVSDGEMSDQEITKLAEMVEYLPVFRGINIEEIGEISRESAEILSHDNGLSEVLAMIKGGLPNHLRETAYALACEVAAADGYASQEELRLLELIRDELDIERLIAAGIERGARARHMIL